MAKKKSTSFSSYKSGLGSYPLAVKPGEFLETTTVVPEMTPINASDAMQYQNFSTGKSYLNQTNDAFINAGFDPYKQSVASAIASNPIAASTSPSQSGLGLWGDGMNASVPKQEASGGFGSYLEGFTGGVKDIGKSVWNAVTPTSASDTYAKQRADWLAGVGKDYVAPTIDNGIMTSPGSGTSFDDYIKQTQAQQGINNQQWATGMQAGLGAVNGIFGAMSYFDNKAMNKKNMQLIDQQIANNQDVMKTRTERAGDIKKYFG